LRLRDHSQNGFSDPIYGLAGFDLGNLQGERILESSSLTPSPVSHQTQPRPSQ
jgi:hypothetical protein